MWLLSTDRAELHYFLRSFDAAGGYAILSHTWDGNEQTLQEVRAIGERCKLSGTNPRDDRELSPKIRECCIVAEADGYLWIWLDSCCIDKTSSSELSESINSMYRWYAQSEVCYAYLADVPDDCVLNAPWSEFKRSRWHTRGWTLQELIAPDILVFLSRGWRELGNKMTHAPLLEQITRVPAPIFTGQKKPSDYSVGYRMHWASQRKTTRREDEAYCLMGLFGVNMSTNYGEGEKAFTRLQYEILRHSEDMSLFAFGDLSHFHQELKSGGVSFCPESWSPHPHRYLLATSPRDFFHPAWPITEPYAPGATFGNDALIAATSPFGTVGLPRISVTSYGIKLRLPVFESFNVTVAVLMCESLGGYLSMVLNRDPTGEDPTRPRYYVHCCGYREEHLQHNISYRLTTLGRDLEDLRFNGEPINATWRTIYMVPGPVDISARKCITQVAKIYTPFTFPKWLASRILALQYDIITRVDTLELIALWFVRRYAESGGEIYVFLGLCRANGGRTPPAHWAKAVVWDGDPTQLPENLITHSCSEHHIDAWKGWTRDFGGAQRTLRLSFTRHRRNPQTRVVHIELFGRVFEKRLREANISFPPLPSAPTSSPPSSSTAPAGSFASSSRLSRPGGSP